MEEEYRFIRIATVSELPAGERIFFELFDLPIVVFNVGGELFAIGDVCTHDNGPLGDGEVEDHAVKCPRHGARFDLQTGKALSLPAVRPAPSYPLRVVDRIIEIGIPASIAFKK